MAHRRTAKVAAKERRARDAERLRRRQRVFWLGGGALTALVVVVAAILILPLATQPIPTGPTEGPRPGQAAPAFTIVDVDGRTWDLLEHRGKVVVLDFMGSRCTTCIVEMPHLVETYERFQGQDFAMISIDVGGGLGTEDPDVARNFLATHGGTWPIALDNQGLAVRYDTGGALPTLVVIDKTGIVRDHHPGIKTSADLTALVQSLL